MLIMTESKSAHRFRRRLLSALFLIGIALVYSASAQVAPSAFSNPRSLWVGADFSYASPDFPDGSSQRIQGAGAFVSYHWLHGVGFEAQGRWLSLNGYQGESESTFLAGPRYSPRAWGRTQPYVRMLAGQGRITFPFQLGTGQYFAFAPAAGLDYRLARHIALRAQYEYQFWPSFPAIVGVPNNGLDPSSLSVGVSYRIF